MFIHLETHSGFSFGRGVAHVEALVGAARARGFTALALTDTNGLYGMVRFLQACREARIRPIVGAELEHGASSAVLLVRTAAGYRALCRALTARHQDPHFDLARRLLCDGDGLVVLSHDPELLRALARGRGLGDLYAALKPGGTNAELLAFARAHGIRPVATCDVQLLDPEDRLLQKVRAAIHHNSALSRVPPAALAHPGAWLMPAGEVARRVPAGCGALASSERIAADCGYVPDLGLTRLPRFTPPDGSRADQWLAALCREGARWRYGDPPPAGFETRLRHELGLIRGKGFADYFLIVRDIVQQCPRTCGRGSAAASLVAYLLGITHVDPLGQDLFFERFLNRGRKDPPDIDVDFPWDERDAVLDYVFRRYGAAHTAMIANQVSFQTRAAVREVAKVFGLPEAELKEVGKRLEALGYSRIEAGALGQHPLLRDLSLPPPWPEIFALAQRLDQVPRHLSVHCGGVVITPEPITDLVPVEQAPKGVPVIQWEKDQAEDFGLVKIDLLGNRSLAVVRDALELVERHGGPRLEYARFNPLEDPAAVDLLARGDSVGVFYVESPAMRQLQKKTRRGDFEHLVIHSSIIRPAANDYINAYVDRLNGAPYTPLHPKLAELLRETYGIMVYQEDVSRAAMALAGFEPAAADELRKVLCKKRAGKQLEDYRQAFFRGCEEGGVEPETVAALWRMIESFKGYSFCKPHSASYALLSFKSAYLRAHYPAEFMAAVLSNGGGYYSSFAYISECRRMGLKVLPPDLNRSAVAYSGRRRAVRVGLRQIQKLELSFLERLVAERRRAGPFTGFEDFLRRVKPQPAQARRLVLAGACDRVEPGRTRPELLWQLKRWERSEAAGAGGPTLFPPGAAGGGLARPEEPPLPRPPQYRFGELLRQELASLGLLLSRHPLTLYQEQLRRYRPIRARDLGRHLGERVTMIGWWVTGKLVESSRQEPMEFITFEDTTALFETTFFPRAYARFCHLLQRARPYVLRGKVEDDRGAVSLNVDQITLL